MTRPNVDPQDPLSPMYVTIDTQPLSSYPNTLDSSPTNFTVRQKTPTGITSALPIVVTIASHGFVDGNVVRATKFKAATTGMEQLNNKSFTVQRAATNTFELFDVYGVPINGASYTTYISGGEFTLSGNNPLIVNPSPYPT